MDLPSVLRWVHGRLAMNLNPDLEESVRLEELDIYKPELANVCIVISDLKATYLDGSASINRALRDFENETHRGAMQLTPVALNSDDIFHILRKRLVDKLPEQKQIDAIATTYAQSVKDARSMDITSANPDDYRRELAVSYPFHFSLRDLYARFRENPGFQQTRATNRSLSIPPSPTTGSVRIRSTPPRKATNS